MHDEKDHGPRRPASGQTLEVVVLEQAGRADRGGPRRRRPQRPLRLWLPTRNAPVAYVGNGDGARDRLRAQPRAGPGRHRPAQSGGVRHDYRR